VLSAAPTERERAKMAALVAMLPHKPWRVFAGELDLVQLSAVIQQAAVHLCGDTGTLHLALMTGTPTVSWFRAGPGTNGWIPVGDTHRTLFGTVVAEREPLQGVETSELVRAVQEILGNPKPELR